MLPNLDEWIKKTTRKEGMKFPNKGQDHLFDENGREWRP